MTIRRATEGDARRISYLIYKSIDHISDKNYSEEQIAAWKKINTPTAIKKSLQRKVIFCAYDYNKLVGTIGLKDGEAVGLYISYWKTRQGIGGLLLRHLEKYAKDNHMKTLKVTSIPSAEDFYLRKGYQITKQVLTDLEGVKFPEKEMIKTL
ncbi:MAG: GNAT family N-acetyltransferase [Bacteroidota bacterium]